MDALVPNEGFFPQFMELINGFVSMCELIAWEYLPIRAWGVFMLFPLRILQVCGTHRPRTPKVFKPRASTPERGDVTQAPRQFVLFDSDQF